MVDLQTSPTAGVELPAQQPSPEGLGVPSASSHGTASLAKTSVGHVR